MAAKTSPTGLDALEKIEPDFVRKFHDDPILSQDLKEAFVEHLNQFPYKKGEDMKQHALDFMWKNQLCGQPYDKTEGTLFVRMNDFPRFQEWLSEIIDRDISEELNEIFDPNISNESRQMIWESIMEGPLKEHIIHEPEHTENFMGYNTIPGDIEHVVKEARTGPYIEWSYPTPENVNELDSYDTDNLDCRAGLSENKDLDKVIYMHNLSDCPTVCAPTIFDAAFYAQFEPGGKTIPLEECKHLEGFVEYVHERNKFKYFIEAPHLILKKAI